MQNKSIFKQKKYEYNEYKRKIENLILVFTIFNKYALLDA